MTVCVCVCVCVCATVHVCVCQCVSVCPHSNRKTARAINTKIGTHTLHGSQAAFFDLEVKRSNVKVMW